MTTPNPTDADIACQLVDQLPPGIFAHAARDAVIHHDFTKLQRMFAGRIDFTVYKPGPDQWELVGVCTDGSKCFWKVGDYGNQTMSRLP